jgi:hypothetical protein
LPQLPPKLVSVPLSANGFEAIIAKSAFDREEQLRRHTILLLGLCLSACGQAEPRAVQYFEANIGEAREIVAACRDSSKRGGECANAEIAVQTVEGRERFERFRGKK